MKKLISKLLLTIIAANLIFTNPAANNYPASPFDCECTSYEIDGPDELTGH